MGQTLSSQSHNKPPSSPAYLPRIEVHTHQTSFESATPEPSPSPKQSKLSTASPLPNGQIEQLLQYHAQQKIIFPMAPLQASLPAHRPIQCMEAVQYGTDRLLAPKQSPIYLSQHTLGQGSYGQVSLACYEQKWFAVKVFSANDGHTSHPISSQDKHFPQHITFALEEAKNMFLARSPLTPSHMYFTAEKAYLLEPLMLGDAHKLATSVLPILKNKSTLQGLSLLLLQGVLPSLQFIHRNMYAHRDIKPGNILFRGHQFTLADYGLMGQAKPNDDRGTLIAPENWRDHRPSSLRDGRQMDVWCLGISMLWLMVPEYLQPYMNICNRPRQYEHFFQAYYLIHAIGTQMPEDRVKLIGTARNNLWIEHIDQMFKQIDPQLLPLVQSMCHPNPEQRPTVDQIAEQLPKLFNHYHKERKHAEVLMKNISLSHLSNLAPHLHPLAKKFSRQQHQQGVAASAKS